MTKRKKHNDFVKEIWEIYGSEYEVIGTYTLSKNPIEIKHKCGHMYFIAPNNLLKGRKCPKCSHKNRYSNTKEFQLKINKMYSNNISVLEDYKGCNEKIEFLCNKHNVKFNTTPTNILRNKNICKECIKCESNLRQRKPLNEVINELLSKHKGKIILVGEYYNTHTKTNFQCNECKNTFFTEPNSILRISGCPYCQSSKGEKHIESYLSLNNITFETQKRFEECKYKRTLPFDFYLEEYNVIIEFDGEQHYKPIDFFGGIEYYKTIKRNDLIKNSFASSYGIKLIRIPYYLTQDEIIDTLDNELTQGITNQN